MAGEANVGVVLTHAVIESAEREESEFDVLPDVPLGEAAVRIFTLHK